MKGLVFAERLSLWRVILPQTRVGGIQGALYTASILNRKIAMISIYSPMTSGQKSKIWGLWWRGRSMIFIAANMEKLQ